MQIADKGIKVQELQRQLAATGFDPGPVDAVFGPLTRRAVEQLQRYCGLERTALPAGKSMMRWHCCCPTGPSRGAS